MTTFTAPKRTTIRANGPKTSTHSGCYYAGRKKAIRVIVVHDGETGESTAAAEGMGYWFQDPDAKGSAHLGVDPDSICRYVDDDDTAWGAPGANADGLHLEHAGKASQTDAQWADDASLRILENGAIAAAEWCIAHRIPARWLTDDELANGVTKGITTHAQCSRVLGGSHTDPGPNFPRTYWITRVRFHITRITTTGEDDMYTDADRARAAQLLDDADGATIRKDIGYARDQLRADAAALRADVAALTTAVTALAGSSGSGVDPAELVATIDTAVRDRLDRIDFTVVDTAPAGA